MADVDWQRELLLERYGRFYGDEHFAVTFTASTVGDDAKRVTTSGWDKTRPLATGDFAAGLISERGQDRNIAIVLRPSNLVVLECDSEVDLVAIEALKLPRTLTVRSSEPYKRHFYFRPPEALGTLPFVAFRFESGKVTADTGRYFLAPPSLHPSGVMYDFLPELGPEETDIVELPEDTYRELVERARRESDEQRERIQVDPDSKIYAGGRRETIFRYACMLRRWGRPYEAILEECQKFNLERCEPPVARELVAVQVKGAMKKTGDQEIERAAGEPPIEIVFEPLRRFLQRAVKQSASLVGVARGGTNLLPQYGWVLPWGREGSGKTSVLLDLLFHIAAGEDWLHYPVAKPVKVVVVINEGVPGGLQDKLKQKIELWDGDGELIQDNLAIYASPWGSFTFRDRAMVDHARDYALGMEADYVALDPLHTLGSVGAGSPQDTEAFKNELRAFGLWDDLGVITAHHSNKAGMISGDWARHADTVIHLEKDGKNPATKITLEKARPADPNELGVPAMLDWVVETLGYTRRALPTDSEKVSDEEMLERIKTYLRKTTGAPNMGTLQNDVTGDSNHVAEVARAAVARGDLRNMATRARWYAFALPEGPVGDSASLENWAQTRMDTEISSTDPPSVGDELSSGPASSGSEALTDPHLTVGEGVSDSVADTPHDDDGWF